MKYIKKFEMKNDKKYYPFHDIAYFVDWFEKKYIEEMVGWNIYNSDFISKKWYSDNDCFWQIQMNDENEDEFFESDEDAIIVAKKLGLMIDKEGVVVGYNGDLFIENDVPNSNILDIYKNMIKYNL